MDRSLLAKIAPAIRMLSDAKQPPIVRFTENRAELPCQHVLKIASSDLEEIYAALRQSMTAQTQAVDLDGLGLFRIVKPKTAPVGRLAGKIAIVTGSAQGFGEGLARYMAEEGAHIVIADLNEELAEKNAARFNLTYGERTAIAAKVDVSNEESVQAMLEKTVLAFGGLDIFVSNAGVLRSGSLDELDLRTFEFVTKVNYTAYFICVKYASKILKLQQWFAPDYMTDIIQINSKSGLEGSNKNFAYAGGKFGGIGLTQSFAKELVEFNIKVNAICPGNYFGGPLWSDPENGLFVQYLRAGKVPGAKTIEDVKRFYEDKVPMRKGCDPIDVARALFYIVEQKYETGQALPVTGGQNMLS